MSKQISRVAFAIAIATASTTVAAGTAQAAPDEPTRPAVTGINPSQYGTVERIAGRDRVATSVEAAKALVKTHGRPSTVIITRGDLFPDALATVPLADQINAPVLLNSVNRSGNNTLHPLVAKFIKDNGVSNVVILGDEVSVGVGVARALENLVGYHKVDRVGGEDRFETAYMLAADTAAAYGNAFAGDLAAAKQELRELLLAERNYQEAMDEYQAASSAFAQARANRDAAAAAVAKQQQVITDLASKLVNVPNIPAGYGSWDDYIKEAQDAWAGEKGQYDRAASALYTFAVTLGALEPQGETTLDIKSTLAEYKAKYPALAAQINDAIAKTPGVSDGTRLEEAIRIATANADAAWADLDDAAEELSARVAAKQRAAAAVAANQPILEQMGRENVKLAQLQVALTAAEGRYAAAMRRLQTAQSRLAAAVANRPFPGDITQARRDVAAARDAVVRAAGNRSAFVSDGNVSGFALAAGPAAAKKSGVMLLSDGRSLGTWAARYINLSNAQTVGVGDKATNAVGTNTTKTFPSSDPSEVANKLGRFYWENEQDDDAAIAVASTNPWADSITGGSFISQYDGLLLTTETNSLNRWADDYVKFSARAMDDVDIRLFGDRISEPVRQQLLVSIHY